jgi:hypothetical protein
MHGPNGTRTGPRRRHVVARARGRRRDDGGETDEQMRDGGVRVRSIDSRATNERTNATRMKMNLDWKDFQRARSRWGRRGTTMKRARVR